MQITLWSYLQNNELTWDKLKAELESRAGLKKVTQLQKQINRSQTEWYTQEWTTKKSLSIIQNEHQPG